MLGRVGRRLFQNGILVLALLGAGCEDPVGRSYHAPPCPEGALDLPARADAIVARLASVPEGAALIEATRPRLGRICFGRGPSVLEERERHVVLDTALGPGEAAARLGHLLMHVRDGSPYAPGADCDAVVARALDAEARAHALELELRRALSAERGALSFGELEAAFWDAPASERVAGVRAYLEAHPDGAPGIDALASGYRARCERDRSTAQRR